MHLNSHTHSVKFNSYIGYCKDVINILSTGKLVIFNSLAFVTNKNLTIQSIMVIVPMK